MNTPWKTTLTYSGRIRSPADNFIIKARTFGSNTQATISHNFGSHVMLINLLANVLRGKISYFRKTMTKKKHTQKTLNWIPQNLHTGSIFDISRKMKKPWKIKPHYRSEGRRQGTCGVFWGLHNTICALVFQESISPLWFPIWKFTKTWKFYNPWLRALFVF